MIIRQRQLLLPVSGSSSRHRFHSIGFLAVLGLFLCIGHSLQAARVQGRTDSIVVFGGKNVFPGHRNANISYNLESSSERFLVHVPSSYEGEESWGLIVYTDADESVSEVPDGWASVLDRRKLLFIAAENAGNNQYNDRRMGLTVLGAMEMMKHYRIDPNRVYAAGFSGGARVAGLLGFFQADVFRGTIQNCGADFYRRVPTTNASSWISTTGQPYGVFHASSEDIAQAKPVRFVLITGSQDFRRGNILDVFNGGFVRDGFHAKLFDIPGMGHDTCNGAVLDAAIRFIEGSA